jgi:hypothetical protein
MDSVCIIHGGGCVSELLLTALFVISLLFVKKALFLVMVVLFSLLDVLCVFNQIG